MTAARRQLRLIATLERYFGDGFAVISSKEVPWASATFCGARHMLAVRLTGTAATDADQRLHALPDYDFPVSSQLIADIRLVSDEADPTDTQARIIHIEALTLDAH